MSTSILLSFFQEPNAVSALCSFETRPTSGLISFCSQTLVAKEPALLIALTARHLISLLGFDWRIIRRSEASKSSCFLINAETLKCWRSASANKRPPLLLTSPQVFERAKAFMGNKPVLGLPLSANGRAWDSHLMFTSLLADSPITSDLAPWLSLDAMTLAFLDDLGWYQVQWHIFPGDDLVWGRGGDSTDKSCDSACDLGFCNRTQDSPCFQLGLPVDSCTVCQRIGQLRAVGKVVCTIESCSLRKRTYRGFCATDSRNATFNCPGSPQCIEFEEVCKNPLNRTFVAKLAARIAPTSTTSTPRTTTIVSTIPPANGEIACFENL